MSSSPFKLPLHPLDSNSVFPVSPLVPPASAIGCPATLAHPTNHSAKYDRRRINCWDGVSGGVPGEQTTADHMPRIEQVAKQARSLGRQAGSQPPSQAGRHAKSRACQSPWLRKKLKAFLDGLVFAPESKGQPAKEGGTEPYPVHEPYNSQTSQLHVGQGKAPKRRHSPNRWSNRDDEDCR